MHKIVSTFYQTKKCWVCPIQRYLQTTNELKAHMMKFVHSYQYFLLFFSIYIYFQKLCSTESSKGWIARQTVNSSSVSTQYKYLHAKVVFPEYIANTENTPMIRLQSLHSLILMHNVLTCIFTIYKVSRLYIYEFVLLLSYIFFFTTF